MNKNFLNFLSIVVFSIPVLASDNNDLLAENAELLKIADGFAFTEGPAVDSEGNVFFTDQPNDRILMWSVDGKLSVFVDGGRSNGLFFDKNGNLLACADNENELWSISPDGSHKVLIDNYGEKRLNGPNDLWIHPNGSIYFTDPLYVRNYWKRSPKKQQDGEYVYLFIPDRSQLSPVATDLVKPNGIIGTPDGKLLYVADIGAGKTYVYDVKKDGTLANKRLFVEMGSDGMTIDHLGNIYLTGKGVTIFNPKGERIAHIPVNATWTANVTFGGKDRKTLFITASEAIYTIRMNVAGVY